MSQITTIVDCAKNGSMWAVSASGISTMSDSLIAFQPAIEEPSNITPSANISSSTSATSMVTCCILPLGSVNRRSTNLTSLSLTCLRMSLAVVISFPCLMTSFEMAAETSPLNGGDTGCACADAHDLLDVGDEDLAVADAAGLCGATDRVDGAFDGVVAQHHLDLHLRQKIDDVLRPPIELGMALLAAETFGLGDRNALQANLLKRLFDLIKLERFDDRF